MPDYGSSAYWDERYAANEQNFDWYQDFSSLEEYIIPHLKDKDAEILIPGCGNSTLGVSLYDIGYTNITNIDISQVLISQIHDLYANREEMEFTTMDARNMDVIPEDCFDLIIDKALFDSMLCSTQNLADVMKLLKEVERVLKPDGVYILISHGNPEKRLSFLEQTLNVDIEVVPIVKPEIDNLEEEEAVQFHYIYIITKKVK